jgi:nitrite reductase/ring-hydroxylating ferredoxin subunit
MPDFVRVTGAADLPPGNGMVVEVDGRPIALFNVGGQFYALDNTCVHRGGPLGEGYVDSSNLTVQCPWHGWVYSLVNGASPVDPMAKVEKFEVKVEGEDVMVAVE